MDLRDLIALAWKRRWVVLGVFAITVIASTPAILSRPTEYESTAVVALTPDVAQGQGLVASDSLSALLGTYAETAKSSINLARAEADPRPQARRGHRHLHGGRQRHPAHHRARDRRPRARPPRRRRPPRRSRTSIAGNKLMIATLVDPGLAGLLPGAASPAAAVRRRRRARPVRRACLLAIALEQFRRRIDTAADVAQHTLAPVLGRLGRQRTLSRGTASMIWDQTGVDDLQESYRALRTNLEFLMDEIDPRDRDHEPRGRAGQVDRRSPTSRSPSAASGSRRSCSTPTCGARASTRSSGSTTAPGSRRCWRSAASPSSSRPAPISGSSRAARCRRIRPRCSTSACRACSRRCGAARH